MASGTIKSYDRDNGNGYIAPEHGGDAIPFDKGSLAEGEHTDDLRPGDRVLYEVDGGLAGVMATHVRRVSRRA